MSKEVDVETAVRFLYQHGLTVHVGYDAAQELVAMEGVDVNGKHVAFFEIVGGLIDGGVKILAFNVDAWRRERDDEVASRRGGMYMVPMAA